jgi:hypothetical protein
MGSDWVARGARHRRACRPAVGQLFGVPELTKTLVPTSLYLYRAQKAD